MISARKADEAGKGRASMKKRKTDQWYSVRCVFVHAIPKGRDKKYLYEERITVWKTSSIKKALELADMEAVEYCADGGCRYLKFAQAYHLYADRIGNGVEVFSLMRDSFLPYGKYLNKHFDTGWERCR